MAEAVYTNPRCPEHVLSIRLNLVKGQPQYDHGMFKLACLNSNAPQDLLIRMIDEDVLDDDLRASLAACAKGEALQFKLARDRLASVVAGLILNPSLLNSVKSKLLEEGKSSVRQAFAKHPGLTEDEQRSLLSNASPALRGTLSKNPKLSAALQLNLANDPDPDVREKLASNPSLIKEAQQILAEDGSYQVKRALSDNPALCLDHEQKMKFKKHIMETRHLGGSGGGFFSSIHRSF
ncbi:hypothetical protein D3C80_1169860 [compost metagenome]